MTSIFSSSARGMPFGTGSGVDTGFPAENYHTPDGGPFHHIIYMAVTDDKAIEAVVRPAANSVAAWK